MNYSKILFSWLYLCLMIYIFLIFKKIIVPRLLLTTVYSTLYSMSYKLWVNVFNMSYNFLKYNSNSYILICPGLNPINEQLLHSFIFDLLIWSFYLYTNPIYKNFVGYFHNCFHFIFNKENVKFISYFPTILVFDRQTCFVYWLQWIISEIII